MKKLMLLAWVLILIFLFVACSTHNYDSNESNTQTDTKSTSTAEPTSTTESTTADDTEADEPDLNILLDISGIDENIVADAYNCIDLIIDCALEQIETLVNPTLSRVRFPFEPQDNRTRLSDAQQAIYDRLKAEIESFQSFTYTSEKDYVGVVDDVMAACYALFNDYPELKNCTTTREINEKVNGNMMTVGIQSAYIRPWDGTNTPLLEDEIKYAKEDQDHFLAITHRIIERMPRDCSTIDQYMYLASIICLTTEYDFEMQGGLHMCTPYGAISGKTKAICEGYARGYEWLCRQAGLYCKFVEGADFANFAHSWNMVKIEDGTYYVDITWMRDEPGTFFWDSYFLLTQEQLLRNHVILDGTQADGTKDYQNDYFRLIEQDTNN